MRLRVITAPGTGAFRAGASGGSIFGKRKAGGDAAGHQNGASTGPVAT